MKPLINIVWIKRDIRTQDHEPLYWAEKRGIPYIIIFIFEPSLIEYPDTSLRHIQFQFQSLLDMNQSLAPYQKQVQIFNAEATTVFSFLMKEFQVQTVFSYQESGINLTYKRDQQLAKYFKQNGVLWEEFQRDGMIRGIRNREGWDKKWYARISQSIIKNEYSVDLSIKVDHPFLVSEKNIELWSKYVPEFQPAGETFAWRYLHSFIAGRGEQYHKYISKPMASRTSCSRLSPYLSWGNISIRQAYQTVFFASKKSTNKFGYRSFLTRLKWHCHFIQKFEVDCTYETQCVNQGYELLVKSKNELWIEAWKKGETGFPLVDACMKCLIATGWINFRMRAMLVSFFCHHLYQDWREGAYYLAQLFLDYEPGIHYTQFQMQAGTTGINVIRMYNPVKQSKDHDPEGIFIKKWLPVLAPLPTEHVHEPYLLTPMEQSLYGITIGVDYPLPIIDLESSGKFAREQIWSHKKNEIVQTENKKILSLHVRPRKK